MLDLKEIKLEVFDQWGFVDRLMIRGNQAHLIDYKFGFNPVDDAEHNAQMWAYTLGVFDKYDYVQDVTVHVLQPRLDLIFTHKFNREVDYGRIGKRIKGIIEKCKNHTEADYTPGDQCVYCNKLSECPAVHGATMQIVKAYDLAHDAQLPELFHPSQLATPERRAQAQRIAMVMEAWCSSVRKHNLEFAKEGGEIPGYGLKEVQGRREIKDPQKAWEAVKGKLTPEEFSSACEVKFTDLADLVAAKAPRGQKTVAKEQLEDALTVAEAMTRGEPSYQLRKIKDTKLLK
jgi:hypothetical protein